MTLDRDDDIRRREDGDGVEPAVAELRVDIEETRLEMGETLTELGDRLEPGHLVEQAKENVRDATIGRVEETAKGVSDMVMETIRRNPIPAAMAGAGLALLWMNRSGGTSNGAYRDAAQYREEGPGLGDRIGEGASVVGERVGEAGETVRQTIGDAGETVGQTVGQAGQQLDRFMQASPLAMGAIAVGAGAVIGALVPETQIEREKLGEAGRQIGEAVRDSVGQAADQAERSIDEAERSLSASGSGVSGVQATS